MIKEIQQKQSIGKILLVALITAIVVGISVYCWMLNNYRKINQTQKQVSSFSSSSSDNQYLGSRDYSLFNYPIRQSPIFDEWKDGDCSNDSWEGMHDTRLMRNGKVLIQSLAEKINSAISPNECPSRIFADTNIAIFSAPIDGKYLYLQTYDNTTKSTAIDNLFRLNLSDLSIKQISSPYKNGSLYQLGYWNDYILLPDGKRLIMGALDKIYLVSLETDSIDILYNTPKNQWLVSSIDAPSDGSDFNYNQDIKLEGNQVTVGIYDKTKNQEDKTVKEVFGETEISYFITGIDPNDERNNLIKFKFIKRVGITIPSI